VYLRFSGLRGCRRRFADEFHHAIEIVEAAVVLVVLSDTV
jgi:hypothetical protein